MMSKKDYVAIAAAILKARQYHTSKDAQLAHDGVSARIADVMTADNPRFNRAKFLKACGVQP